jgi:hypothetical protein
VYIWIFANEYLELFLYVSVLFIHIHDRGRSLDEVKLASRLEEEFQVEIWGVVEGGHDMDRLNNSVSLSSVVTFMRLYKTDEDIKSLFMHR